MNIENLSVQLHNALGSFWKFFAGALVVIVGFYGNFFDLKQADVSIEITKIEQVIPTTLDFQALAEFSTSRSLISPDDQYFWEYMGKDSLKDFENYLDRIQQKIADRERDLREITTKANNIPPANVSQIELKDEELDKLDMVTYFNYYKENIHNSTKENAQKKVDELQKQINDKNDLLKKAREEVKNFKEKSEKNDAKIIVTVVISNPGDGSTTLKSQALLRTDLGQGNYLDINLSIPDYGSANAEIKPRSASIIRFESPSIGEMAPADRARFTSFFKNTSPTKLYIGDVRKNFYESNTIPFAQGIYEQKIYDELKRFASDAAKLTQPN